MRIDIYTSPTCGYCHQAKRFLDERRIQYFEYDVSRDQDAAERMVNLTGQMGVPVLVIDGQVVLGFDRNRIDSLLAAAGNGHRRGLGLSVADAVTYASRHGAYVGTVRPSSPAERAGLHKGDVIVSIDHKSIDSAEDLEREMSSLGDSVVIGFVRGDQDMQALVTLSS